MFDLDKAGEAYDHFMDHFGSPPPTGVGRFDRRLLVPRMQVPDWVQRDSHEELSLEELDILEGEGVFSWLRGAGDDGRDLGVPMYVPYRIGLCRRLRREGWTPEEIKDLVDWEEWVVTDMTGGDLPYEDDDRMIVLSEQRERLEQLENERISRLRADERPNGWGPHGWTSESKVMSDEALAQEIARLESVLRWLEALDMDKAHAKTRRKIGRRAHQLRMHYEGVRFMAVVSDRMAYEAGFSPLVHFEGLRSLVGDPARLETFGRVDWYETLRSWRVMNDPDRAPIRLPGFVCVGGVIHMPNALAPEQYSERHSLFRLDQYHEAFVELVGDRHCQHCGKRLPKKASDRRLYCNPKCSQANRQKRHRWREKAGVLWRRAGGRSDHHAE